MTRRRTAALLAAALSLAVTALVPPALAAGPGASAWVENPRSRVRLIAGEATPNARRAGLEIRLDPDHKTYWRNAGDSGLPPTFDWAGSRNVEKVEVAWPAPERFADPSGTSFGYHGGVVLPLTVTPSDPARPARLALQVHYGVCREICIPAQASLALDLPPAGSAPASGAVREAFARVPERQPLGAEGPLSVLAVEPGAGGMLTVRVRAPAGVAPQLFPEGPEGWFLAPPADAENGAFRVEVAERPKDAAGPVPLRFTLVAGSQAVEVPVTVEAGTIPR